MAISGSFINKPGAMDKARAALNKSGLIFYFSVSSLDIENELRKFNNALASDLLKELKAKKPAKVIQKKSEARLLGRVSASSQRIMSIMAAMKRNTRYTTYSGRETKHVGKARNIRMQMFDIKELDKKTNLNKLDKYFPQKHIAPLHDNPMRNLSSAAYKYRGMVKFSLWRMFEYKTKGSYRIPLRAEGPLHFTVDSDGHSTWKVQRTVNWTTRGGGIARSAYFMLDDSRKMYKRDQGVFARAIGYGVQKIIKNKTRFR